MTAKQTGMPAGMWAKPNGQTALVTGSAGFIGRHMTAELQQRGWLVCEADLAHGIDCRDVFAARRFDRFDLVVHAAAVIGGRAGIDGRGSDPLATAENLELDAAMFRWAARARPGRVVYLSSSAVYPVHRQDIERGPGLGPLPESAANPEHYAGHPDQVYGWSKLIGEVLAERCRATGVPVTVVRPFSGYGPDQGTDYPFGAFLARAKARHNPFVIWGDGTQRRDWIHVDDVIAATLTLVDAGVDGPLNLCTGRPVSFTSLADMVAAGVGGGYNPIHEYMLGAPAGVAWRVGDPTRLHRYYRPRITLEAGIADAVNT